MTEIKRYKIQDNFLDLGVKGGLFVREEDYAALQEQVRAQAAENVALRTFHMHSPYAEEYIEPLPATDAALREIRAQVIEGFADYIAFYYSGAKQIARYYADRIRAGEQP